jgi:multiple sugar transport system ATP-binding protein
MAEIVLDGVRKVFPDGTEAVHEFDLEMPDGAFVVLVGPSGCGKTTVLRMVAGLEDVSDGEIRIGGDLVNGVGPRDRDLAMVFQNYALYPHMSVYDNMAFGLKLRGAEKDEIDRRVQEAARMLGLSELLKRKPAQLSGGQRQRVAMGRAIVREPRAFLMDEPLSNLDAKLRVQMRTEISRIQQELGVTTVYVTHDQTEAMTMGDLVAVMRKGVLQQVDGPQALYARPRNLFVAGFIGSPAMNLVTAKLTKDNGTMRAEFAGTSVTVDEETMGKRRGLEGYAGREVILGIRPEDLEDASVAADAPDDRRLKVRADVREDMGAEAYIHFTVDSPPVVTEDVKELASDVGEEDLREQAEEGKTRFIARVSGRAEAKEGEQVELVVDTRGLHFFDPETGDGIYGGGRS